MCVELYLMVSMSAKAACSTATVGAAARAKVPINSAYISERDGLDTVLRSPGVRPLLRLV